MVANSGYKSHMKMTFLMSAEDIDNTSRTWVENHQDKTGSTLRETVESRNPA